MDQIYFTSQSILILKLKLNEVLNWFCKDYTLVCDICLIYWYCVHYDVNHFTATHEIDIFTCMRNI